MENKIYFSLLTQTKGMTSKMDAHHRQADQDNNVYNLNEDAQSFGNNFLKRSNKFKIN